MMVMEVIDGSNPGAVIVAKFMIEPSLAPGSVAIIERQHPWFGHPLFSTQWRGL